MSNQMKDSTPLGGLQGLGLGLGLAGWLAGWD